MKTFHLSLLALMFAFRLTASDHPLVTALSLRETARALLAGERPDAALKLAGRLAGFVRDGDDFILLGLEVGDSPDSQGSLEDLLTAIAARRAGQWPLVSIDPTAETEQTGLQAVRMSGIADSSLGASLLKMDILLKLHSLGLMEDAPRSMPTYRGLIEDELRASAKAGGWQLDRIDWRRGREAGTMEREAVGAPVNLSQTSQARFWFYVIKPYVPASRDGVFCIKELNIGVEAELHGPPAQGRDTPASRYAAAWRLNYGALCRWRPALSSLKRHFDMVAIAEGIRTLGTPAYLDAVLAAAPFPARPTTRYYRLEEVCGSARRSDGCRHLIRLSGGVTLRPEIQFLNAGDYSPLVKLVHDARPSDHSLKWAVDLPGWRMPNTADLFKDVTSPALYEPKAPGGCFLTTQQVLLGGLSGAATGLGVFSGFAPINPPTADLRGVSLQILIPEDGFHPDRDGAAGRLREAILGRRPPSGALDWRTDGSP